MLAVVSLLVVVAPRLEAEILQVGAFSRQKNIERRVSMLEEWGYKANLVKTPEGFTRIRVKIPVDTGLSALKQQLNRHRIEYFTVRVESEARKKDPEDQADWVITVEKLKNKINKVMGTEYQWGGEAPARGFDCSGLLNWLFLHPKLPRTVAEMYQWTVPVKVSELKTGDFIYFKFRSGAGPDHIGLYLGGGKFVHASSSYGVIKAKLGKEYYQQRLISYGRPPVALLKQ
jgi:hypothetical protein